MRRRKVMLIKWLRLHLRFVCSLNSEVGLTVGSSASFQRIYHGMSAAGTVNILEKELSLDQNARRYSFQELENATNRFKEPIGEGNLGPVFRGRLSDGTDVAIKMRSDSLQLDADSFLKEVQVTLELVSGMWSYYILSCSLQEFKYLPGFLVKLRSLFSTLSRLRFGRSIQVLFLSKVRHQNLLQLKGFCLEFKKQFLVFEFMSGGSLKDHLYGKRPGNKY